MNGTARGFVKERIPRQNRREGRGTKGGDSLCADAIPVLSSPDKKIALWTCETEDSRIG